MRMTYALCFLVAAFAVPAAADDLKQEVEKLGAAYADNFNKHDAAGIAALYATGGVHVNPMGPRTDIEDFYKGLFKAGFDHQESKLDQASPLGADAAVSMGEYRITGKNQSGEPIEAAGRWTAVDVREDSKWKIRMLSAFPKAAPPPAK